MSGELSVETAALQRHASGVDDVADAVRTAASAVHDVTMDSQAYGQLCQFLPGLLTPLFGLAQGAINRSAASLGQTAAKLRTTAGEMNDTDAGAVQRVRRSLPKLPL